MRKLLGFPLVPTRRHSSRAQGPQRQSYAPSLEQWVFFGPFSICWFYLQATFIKLPCHFLVHMYYDDIARDRWKLHGQIWCWNYGFQMVEKWSSQQDVIGGIGLDYEISYLDSPSQILSLPEHGVKINVTSCVHTFSRKTNDLAIVWLDFCLQYPHLFECFPIKYVNWTPLINKCYHDSKIVDVHHDYHKVMLCRIDCFEISICEGDGEHPRSGCTKGRVHRLHDTKVFLLSGALTSSSSEATCYCVNDFSIWWKRPQHQLCWKTTNMSNGVNH